MMDPYDGARHPDRPEPRDAVDYEGETPDLTGDALRPNAGPGLLDDLARAVGVAQRGIDRRAFELRRRYVTARLAGTRRRHSTDPGAQFGRLWALR